MIKKYFFLAFRNLKRRGLRSWLTMLGIFIGIAAVVSLITLGQGLQQAILGQFGALSTDKLTVTNAETGFGPPGSTAITKLNDHDINVIKQVSGIEMVIPRLLRPISLEYNKILGFSYAASMPQDEKAVKLIYDTFSAEAQTGRLLMSGDKGKVLLGSEFAKTKAYEKDITTGARIKIQDKEFEVIGILKPVSTFQLNLAILMNEKDMKDLLNLNDEYDLIVVQVAKGADIEQVAKNLKDKIRKDRNEKEGEEDFSVQTPVNMLKSVNTILNIINAVVIGIALVSLLVGAIGIANTMYTSVLERTKEIGVMKAIGARNNDVLLIFLFESGLLGLVGGVIGVLIGVVMAFSAAAGVNTALGLNLFAVKFSPFLIIGSIGFSFIVGIISGVFPAMQASKLKPVEALRK
jgi:putative ABC transport system permease protein